MLREAAEALPALGGGGCQAGLSPTCSSERQCDVCAMEAAVTLKKNVGAEGFNAHGAIKRAGLDVDAAFRLGRLYGLIES